MIIWFLIYTTVIISDIGMPVAETHYRKYPTAAECAIARDALNGTDFIFGACFSKEVDKPTSAPKTSL